MYGQTYFQKKHILNNSKRNKPIWMTKESFESCEEKTPFMAKVSTNQRAYSVPTLLSGQKYCH